MDTNEKAIIEETTKEFLQLLEVQTPITVNEAVEGAEVLLETEDENGILIGYHGETLEALQLILSLCVAKKVGKFIRVSVEVGSYKKNRMEYIQQLVAQTKDQVIAEQKEISLPDLKSWERRFVHMLLKDDAEVISESSGEGRDRVLTIYPKQ